jgi:DNA replication and repair protein RecF
MDEMAVWSRDLAAHGEQLDACRRRYFERLVPAFQTIATAILPECPELALRYRRGWDQSVPYAEALAATEVADMERGYTHVGPQRADMVVSVDGHSAAETLSRGQQKLAVCMRCTYLIDDLPSELDRAHTRHVCRELENIGAQVFITCIDKQAMMGMWPNTAAAPRLFHVEQGRVSPVA